MLFSLKLLAELISIRPQKGDRYYVSSEKLSYQDSNLDKQDQNLLCYHYTIRQ